MTEPCEPTNELRQEYRLSERETVYIEMDSGLVATQSLDLSANGLRVISDREITAGCILRCCVQLKHSDEQFMLACEVKWSQSYADQGEYLLGLSLFESADTDIQAWKEMIARRCAS